MRFCYAHRRFTLFPQSEDSWNLSVENYTDDFLSKVKSTGFDSIEFGYEVFNKVDDKNKLKEFVKKLESHGLVVGAIRSGGSLTDAQNGPANIKKLNQSIRYAEWTNAEIVNGALSSPPRNPGHPPGSLPGSQHGWPISQDSSKEATLWVFDKLSETFKESCDIAKDSDINLTVEVHQNSPVDNSWSALLIHEMDDRKNFGINPDLGNIMWNYDVPEEDFDESISKMASISKYWHCKNLFRIYHPENNRSVYIRTPLPDGDIDYRYAISAMADAKYKGYMAIEGSWGGDQWYHDEKSLSYAKSIWNEFE